MINLLNMLTGYFELIPILLYTIGPIFQTECYFIIHHEAYISGLAQYTKVQYFRLK